MKNIWSDKSFRFLLISNLVVILLAIIENWTFGGMLLAYIIQSMVIGWFNMRRILDSDYTQIDSSPEVVSGGNLPMGVGKYLLAVFFLMHYGGFHLLYLFLVLMLPMFGVAGGSGVWLPTVIGGIVFAYNHYYSYQYHKQKINSIVPNVPQMMFYPYLRVLPMHIVLIVGAFLIEGYNLTTFAVVLFLVLKMLVDLLSHYIQHNKPSLRIPV